MAMQNKKGQDLSIGTLILIVLGIVVLVLLILGFSLGWSNLWEKINIFGGGSSVGDVATACGLAATQENQYGYCQDFKKIKVDGKTEYLNCEDGRIASGLTDKMTCTPESVKTSVQSLCASFDKKGYDETKINGKLCDDASYEYVPKCAQVGGAVKTTACDEAKEVDYEKANQVALLNLKDTEFCCVPK